MDKRYIIFLIIYAFLMGFVLYGIGERYNLDEWFAQTLPDEPTNEWQALWYPIAFAWSVFVLIVNIPIRAFATLSMIANENMIVGVFILLPAVFCIVAIFSDLAKLIRGGG